MGKHIIDGEFQSDKYPDCPRGLIPFKAKDKMAQDLLYEYAVRRVETDPEFSNDLFEVLRLAGYDLQGRWTKREVSEAEAPEGYLSCRILLSHEGIKLLDRLVETGLFGSDPSSAALRLVEQGLEKRFFIEEPHE